MRQLFRTPNDPSALDGSNPSTEPKRYLRIVLDKATDLPVGDQALLGGASDPYIIFEFGEHRLRSTIVTQALNPSWRREQFEFVLTESEVQEHQKLHVTVLDYDLAKKDDLLGTFEIDMAAWQGATTLGDMAIQPYDINVPHALAKQQKHPQLHLGIALLTEVEAMSTFIMQIWEHERWEPIKGWNHDHLKASKDPPVWLSETDGGKTGGANFTDAILAAPAGYKEKTTWESKVAFGDGEGWTYSKSFDDVAWHDQGHLTRIARRRLWARQYVRDETATEVNQTQ
ncbi:unnamed protein product [Aphanomyces euteiches]|uniref:C2 domain-containing protein n=1 Tax=Aphanomyces euteiches TaxID=100861 RepID=A0A6G0W659_9STRA|nr:hypothetical protein Ae201684_018303 [Aphanomyces euteiches]KAH9137329.1 hypothetical protein AeRB84_017879 [Aphanomyces euteiches]